MATRGHLPVRLCRKMHSQVAGGCVQSESYVPGMAERTRPAWTGGDVRGPVWGPVPGCAPLWGYLGRGTVSTLVGYPSEATEHFQHAVERKST